MLCNHPKEALLFRTLQRSHLSWLLYVIPEDVKQESALFLLGWSPEKIDADIKTFFREANRHFYRVAVNYGFRRPKYSRDYSRQAINLEAYEEECLFSENHLENYLNQIEFEERIDFCREVLSPEDYQILVWYLSGYSYREISHISNKTIPEIKKLWNKISKKYKEDKEGINGSNNN